MKHKEILIALWVFYCLEFIGGLILDGDWMFISLVGVLFIPTFFILNREI